MTPLQSLITTHLNTSSKHATIKQLSGLFVNTRPEKAARFAEQIMTRPYTDQTMLTKLSQAIDIPIEQLTAANTEAYELFSAKAHYASCQEHGPHLNVVHAPSEAGWISRMAAARLLRVSLPQGKVSLSEVMAVIKDHQAETGGVLPVFGEVVGYCWSTGPSTQTLIRDY